MIDRKSVVKIWRNHVACVKNFVLFFESNHEFNVRDSNRANTPKVIRSADVSYLVNIFLSVLSCKCRGRSQLCLD